MTRFDISNHNSRRLSLFKPNKTMRTALTHLAIVSLISGCQSTAGRPIAKDAFVVSDTCDATCVELRRSLEVSGISAIKADGLMAGAFVGGLVGAIASNSADRPKAIIAGAIVGGVVGYQYGKTLAADRRKAVEVANKLAQDLAEKRTAIEASNRALAKLTANRRAKISQSSPASVAELDAYAEDLELARKTLVKLERSSQSTSDFQRGLRHGAVTNKALNKQIAAFGGSISSFKRTLVQERNSFIDLANASGQCQVLDRDDEDSDYTSIPGPCCSGG